MVKNPTLPSFFPKNNSPIVSIAMATYNGEEFLREQLDSILAQTITDFELIICDDCSTDGTFDIISDYANHDTRIHVYRNTYNLGCTKNFEKAMRLCKANYIALSDQDDIWYPNHLEVLLKGIGNNVLCAADADMVDSKNRNIGKRLSFAEGFFKIPPTKKLLWRNLFVGNVLQGASMLLRKDFLFRVLPIPVWMYHDSYLASCSCCETGSVYLREPITRYRQHGTNLTINLHNKENRKSIPFKKILLFLAGKFRPLSIRIALCEHLLSIYRENEDLNLILSINKKLLSKNINLQLIQCLWKNYEYITTKDGHKDFIKYFFCWLFAKQMEIRDNKRNYL